MNKAIADIKQSLLKYPSIFKCKLDVLKHMFTVIGGGYDWNKNGELVARKMKGDVELTEIDMSDIDEALEKWNGDREIERAFKYRAELEKLSRKHIERNIDLVASSIHACSHEQQDLSGHYIENPHYEYAKYFSAPGPDDISDEYCDLLVEFGKEWAQFFMTRNQGFYQYLIVTGKELWLPDFTKYKKIVYKMIPYLSDYHAGGYRRVIGSIDPENTVSL